QQRNEELLAERKPGPPEARERRPSPGEPRGQSPKGREAGEERLEPGPALESTPKPLEARDWRQSRGEGEGGDWSTRLPEARRWKLSPEDTQERSPSLAEPGEQSRRRREALDSRLSPGGPARAEAHKWRPEPREAPEQRTAPVEAAEWRLSSEEREDFEEECGREADSPAPWMAPQTAGAPEAPSRDPQNTSRGAERVEQRPDPVEDGERGLGSTEGWKWTLNSGKAQEWTARDIETPSPKPEPPGSTEKRLDPRAVEAGEGGAEAEAGARSRPLGAPEEQGRGSVHPPLPPEDAGPGAGSGPPQEEEAASLQPPAPAPASQPSGDPLMSRLFYGVKAGPGVGAPRRSGHTFTVNPRRSAPPASPAPAPAPGDTAVPGSGKKRYPTAEEILVLGGYLRLSRSCLAKGSPERHHKQLKISFSETALETTFQYPSESSVLEDLGPEPEAPSAPSAPAAQPDDDEDEDEEELLLLQPGLRGGLRTKALLVGE
ncbi:Phostensin, partial [Heterocephalus glaber]